MKISFGLSGLGDELALTACVREIRRQYPNERIDVGARQHRAIWDRNPHLVGGSEDALKDVTIDTRVGEARSLPIQFAGQMGIELSDDSPEIFLAPEELAEDFGLREARRILAIDVFASAANRRWPLDRFQIVASTLQARGWTIIEIGDHYGAPLGVGRSFFRKLTVRRTAALLSKCSLYLGNDSGLAHLAAAVGKPQVVLYGPAAWHRRAYWNTLPVSSPCQGCNFALYACEKAGPEQAAACMSEISPDHVLDAVATAERRFLT